jgi:hypothetical protein
MGVKARSVSSIWPLTATIALIASLANGEVSAQWPADCDRTGMANGLPLTASGPPSAVASPNCWPSSSQQFPPLDLFRSGTNPTYCLQQDTGTQVWGSSPGRQVCNAPGPLLAPAGGGNYASGWSIPPAYATHPCADFTGNAYFGNNCVPVIPARRFYGGFEFLWMRPHFDQNVAMIVDPPIGNTLTPFHYESNLVPRAWLGWQSTCSGAGFRTTYWRFDASAAEERATAVAGATPVYLFVYGAGGNLSRNAYADLGETLVSNHSLMLHTLDFEGTQQFSLASLQCLAGFGVRIAEMDQHLRGEIYDATNSLWEVVTNDLSFQGAGPTVSLQIQRSLGNSRFSVFNGLRGAFLFSDTQQGIYEMKDGFANELTDVAKQTEVLSMGELALGMQYSQCIGPRAQLFVRGNYECQAWFDVGGPVDSHSTVAFSGIGLATGMLY